MPQVAFSVTLELVHCITELALSPAAEPYGQPQPLADAMYGYGALPTVDGPPTQFIQPFDA